MKLRLVVLAVAAVTLAGCKPGSVRIDPQAIHQQEQTAEAAHSGAPSPPKQP